MSSNSSAYFDEYGETSDWIELFNNSSQSINLENYSLSDKRSKLNKWIFPSVTLNSKEFLLVFTSGQDSKICASTWETVFRKGDVCKYFLGTQEPPSDWNDISFIDIGWKIGFTGIGYGDDDDKTIIDQVNSVYIRRNFQISDKNNISAIMFNMDYDDGFVAYINGHEIARENLGNAGEFIAYNRSADNMGEAQLYQGLKLKSYFLTNLDSILIDGNNVIAVQVNNYGTNSSDLSAIPFLTIGYKQSDLANNVADEISSQLPNLHTNFKIANGDESVYLSNNLGEIIDSTKPILLEKDISYGRKPDGENNWFLFNNSTPGSANITEAYAGQTEDPILTFPSGFYNSTVIININNPSSQRKTYYTFNNSEPDSNSYLLNENIYLKNTSVLKLKSFEKDFIPSKTITATYFINVDKQLPVISISTDSANLWDYNTGIYVLGPNAEKSNPYFNANFWQDWSKPATFEFWDTDRNNKLEYDVDIKIFGAWSRALAQKSLAVFAKGGTSFNYKFFPNLDIDSYESIVLRNSGNDWTSTMMRDGFMQTLANNLNVDHQAYRPAVLYLNGVYWGIQNLREKVNLNYFNAHYNVNKDSIDLLEMDGSVIDGDNESYLQMINFLNTHNLSNEANYDVAKNQIDIPSAIDYFLMEIYINNTDWPGNNYKFWKPKTKNGKWRWILYDTDFGFGFVGSFSYNTLALALAPNGPEYPNPPWSTLVLRKLLENPTFKNDFLIRFADLCNTTFEPENVKNLIGKTRAGISSEINSHIEKWNAFSYEGWQNNVQVMNDFADSRLSYLKKYFSNQFGLTGSRIVVVNNQNPEGGKIHFNSLDLDEYPFYGNYFVNTKVKATAVANPGFVFSGWSGTINSQSESIELNINASVNLVANFQKINDFPNVVINEINYNSNNNFDTEDWVELYNNTNETIDLSNWIFSDSNDSNKFIFPEGTKIASYNYLVLSRDTSAFKTFVSNVNYLIGNFDFGLSNSGDLIRLFNNNYELIDSVRYDDSDPWPVEADGTGNTLELKNPKLDNSVFLNWGISSNFGTPGKENSNLIVDVKNNLDEIPNSYNLSQNYPNPFNPSTKISFSIPERIKVTLEIYNAIGEKVDVLVNSILDAGFHEVNFNNSKLSSGVYFYRLKTSNFMQIKKMVLLK